MAPALQPKLDREERLLKKRESYHSNRETNLASMKAYRESAKGCSILMVHRAKARALSKDIPFDLVPEDVLPVLEAGLCEATGLPFDFTQGLGRDSGHRPFTPSLDRISPAAGYTKENTRVVLWMFNAGKGSGTDADMLAMAKALVAKEST